MQLSTDWGQLVAITVDLLHDVLDPQDLLVLLLQLACLEQFFLGLGELAARSTGGVVAFLAVHFHIAVDVHLKDVLVLSAEIVAQSASVADHDV